MLSILFDLLERARRRLSSVAPVLGRTAVVACVLAAGCRHDGNFVSAQDVKSASPETEYHIGRGDVLAVRVWNQEAISTPRARVRDDGRISILFLHDVQAEGRTPSDLARDLEVKLKSFVVNPVVTVSVEETQPLSVSVVGEVNRPGVYDLDPGAGVLQAIAVAGGFTVFADPEALFVLRRQSRGSDAPERIRFRYAALARGQLPDATFRLRRGDVLVVER